MNNILWLVRYMLRMTFRKRFSWIVYFGLPIAGILLSMLIYSNYNGGNLHIGVLNQDGDNALTADTIQYLEGLTNVEVTMTDDASMNKDIAAGKLDSGLIFEAGFGDSVREGQPDHLRIVSAKGATVTSYVKAMLEQYVGNVASIGRAADDSAAFDAIYADYKQADFRFDAESLQDTSHIKDVTYQSIGFLIMFLLFSAVNITELIVKERESRTFLRLLSTPISARGYVFANVLVAFLIQLAQIVIALLLIQYVFHLNTGVPFGGMLGVLLLFSLCSIGLSLLIIAFAKNGRSANALQNLIIVPTCLLAGCFFPAEIMPDTVRKIADFMPQRWLLDTVAKLQDGHSFGSLALNLAILLGFAAAFTLVAVFRFSRNNDVRQFI